MAQKNEYDFLNEWAVWANLDHVTDQEFILLKGHLVIEHFLEMALNRNGIQNLESYSFYGKILALEKMEVEDQFIKQFIISSLREINTLRNKVAHELLYKISDGEFEKWSLNVLENLRGEKFSKYTYRTKIVHSFSVLTKNILEL